MFEQVVVQILRLVDDQNGIAAHGGLLNEKFIQPGPDLEPVQPRHFEAELHGDGLQEQVGVRGRIENERRGPGIAQRREHRAANGGLAGADLAGQLDEPLPLANAIEQMVERLAMLCAEKEKPRVRCEVKRRFLQAIVFQIHAGCLTKNDGREKKNVPSRAFRFRSREGQARVD